VGRRIAAGIGLLLCALGVGVGLWPRHIGISDVRDVSCGRALFPASPPSRRLAQQCWEAMNEEAYASMFFIVAGLITIAAVVYFSWPRKEGEFPVPYGPNPYAPGLRDAAPFPPAQYIPAPQPPVRYAPPVPYAPPAPPTSEQERYWRQQGWVPAHEVQGPPPGWVRVEPGPEQPRH
jgi:hypothetical protein